MNLVGKLIFKFRLQTKLYRPFDSLQSGSCYFILSTTENAEVRTFILYSFTNCFYLVSH